MIIRRSPLLILEIEPPPGEGKPRSSQRRLVKRRLTLPLDET
jgi:hypothetical protein